MLITGTDFNDGAVNYSTCHFVEKERYEQDKHIQIKNGSILITKDGTLGKVAYVVFIINKLSNALTNIDKQRA